MQILTRSAALAASTCMRVVGRNAWLAAIAAPTVVYAQPPEVDPVRAHFREYQAALERDDYAAAETEAAAALAASEAVGGPRTAVLALNLANLRLDLGGGRDALTPARTAHALAGSPSSGVDPLAAALALGRAELAAGDEAGVERLLEAFGPAAERPELAPTVHDAAVALGRWAGTTLDHVTARRAWETAAELAHTADDPALARARALIGVGVSIILAGAERDFYVQSRVKARTPDAEAAYDALLEAQRVLVASAFAEGSAEVTLHQATYARALAWQGVLRSMMRRRDEDVSDFDRHPVVPEGFCQMRGVAGPSVMRPAPKEIGGVDVGAVVVRIGLDASGRVTSSTLAADIPPGAFGETVMAVVDRWRFKKARHAPADCRTPSLYFLLWRF